MRLPPDTKSPGLNGLPWKALLAGGFPYAAAMLLYVIHQPHDQWQHDFLGGRDFGVFHLAALAASQGNAALVTHPAAFMARLRAEFPTIGNQRLFPYPPSALLWVAPLGWLPLGIAWLVFTCGGVAALAGALRLCWVRITGDTGARYRNFLLLALMIPESIDNITVGENGLLLGSLLLISLSSLDYGKATKAGVGFGILTIKPQLGLVLPAVLLARRQWVAILVAVGVTASMALTAELIWPGVWAQWLHNIEPLQTQRLLRPVVPTPTQSFMVSIYEQVRALTTPGVATAIQGTVSLGCIYATLLIWHRSRPKERGQTQRVEQNQNALWLIATTVALDGLAAPYTLNYDLCALQAASVLLWAASASGQAPALTPVQRKVIGLLLIWPGWAFLISLLFKIPSLTWLAPVAMAATGLGVLLRPECLTPPPRPATYIQAESETFSSPNKGAPC